MKVSIFFLAGAMIIVAAVNASPDSDRIGSKMSNAAPKAFGTFKMFDQPVNEQGLVEWYAVIEEGFEIVRKANKKNKELEKYITRIVNANNDLVNGIKGVYKQSFVPFASSDEVSSEQKFASWNYKNKVITLLNGTKNDMVNLIKTLKKSKIFSSKIDEKDVLIELAHYVSMYADNALASIDYKLSTDPKLKSFRDQFEVLEDSSANGNARNWINRRIVRP